jgi:hypothetical protein
VRELITSSLLAWGAFQRAMCRHRAATWQCIAPPCLLGPPFCNLPCPLPTHISRRCHYPRITRERLEAVACNDLQFWIREHDSGDSEVNSRKDSGDRIDRGDWHLYFQLAGARGAPALLDSANISNALRRRASDRKPPSSRQVTLVNLLHPQRCAVCSRAWLIVA